MKAFYLYKEKLQIKRGGCNEPCGIGIRSISMNTLSFHIYGWVVTYRLGEVG